MGILTRILTQILTRNRLGYRLGDVGGRGRATDAEADGAGGGELGGVAEEVVQHLLDPLRVAPASRSTHTQRLGLGKQARLRVPPAVILIAVSIWSQITTMCSTRRILPAVKVWLLTTIVDVDHYEHLIIGQYCGY